MLGSVQHSCLRIEIEATAAQLSSALLNLDHLRQWLWPQQLKGTLPTELRVGLRFQSGMGPITVEHEVLEAESNHLCCRLSRTIDGVHEWDWGEGWVQSRLDGVSLLPLQLANSLTLVRLNQAIQMFK